MLKDEAKSRKKLVGKQRKIEKQLPHNKNEAAHINLPTPKICRSSSYCTRP
jgi:hypothetical protein